MVPFKHYTLAVIETTCAAYVDKDLATITLRQTVERMGPGHPHYSALHGWLGALGERVLGRFDQRAGYLPAGTLIAETAPHWGREVFALWEQPRPVSDRKFETAKRGGELEACARVFAAAAFVFAEAAHPFCQWEQWLQERLHVTAWSFPARANGTGFQHHLPLGPVVELPPRSENGGNQERKRHHGPRSPP
jgi:hypothetical protein